MLSISASTNKKRNHFRISLVMAERRIINLLRLLIKNLLRKKSCQIKSIIITIFTDILQEFIV